MSRIFWSTRGLRDRGIGPSRFSLLAALLKRSCVPLHSKARLSMSVTPTNRNEERISLKLARAATASASSAPNPENNRIRLVVDMLLS